MTHPTQLHPTAASCYWLCLWSYAGDCCRGQEQERERGPTEREEQLRRRETDLLRQQNADRAYIAQPAAAASALPVNDDAGPAVVFASAVLQEGAASTLPCESKSL